MKIRPALYQTMARSLGLSTRNLAEIGGWKDDSFARRIMRGEAPFPADVRRALLDIQDDVDVITDSLISQITEGDQAVIWVFKTSSHLRAEFPEWPGRGKAPGGFVGPHYIAALTAFEILRHEHGIETDILFR